MEVDHRQQMPPPARPAPAREPALSVPQGTGSATLNDICKVSSLHVAQCVLCRSGRPQHPVCEPLSAPKIIV